MIDFDTRKGLTVSLTRTTSCVVLSALLCVGCASTGRVDQVAASVDSVKADLGKRADEISAKQTTDADRIATLETQLKAAQDLISAQKSQLAEEQKRLDALYVMKSQLEQYTEGIKGYQEDFKGLNKDLRDLREYAGTQFQKLTGDTAANTTAIDRTKADLSEKIGAVASDLDKNKTDTNTRLETIKSDLLNARTDLRDSLKRMDDTQQKLEARVNETVKRLTDTFGGLIKGLGGAEGAGDAKKGAATPSGK